MAAVAVAVAASGCSSGGGSNDTLRPRVLLERVETGSLRAEVGGFALDDVERHEEGWLVVGSASEPGGRPYSVAFTSADGQRWRSERLPAPEAPGHWPLTITRAGGRLVVVGVADPGRDSHVVMWTGRPGDWELRELDDELGGHRGIRVGEAVAVGDGAVITGGVQGDDGGWSPRIWRVDGEGELREAEGLEEDVGTVWAVASDGERLLAAGAIGEASAYMPPGLFVSEDGGRRWERVEHRGLDRSTISGLSRIDGAWWAAGSVEGAGLGTAEIWRSADARTWSSVALPGSGTSAVGDVYALGNRVFGLGTGGVWAETADAWSPRWWPGAGERGNFGAAALHDGRLIAIGAPDDGMPGLYTTTTTTPGAPWTRIELADLVLNPATGVADRTVNQVTGSADRLVAVGDQTSIDGEETTQESFIAAAPDFARAGNAARFPGVVVQARHIEGVGFVAAGFRSSDQAEQHGAQILTSTDGQGWQAIVSTNDPNERAQVVVDVEGGPLVGGMTWTDDAREPRPMLWRLTSGSRAEPIVPRGLDGQGIVNGCGRGDTVAFEVTAGGAHRSLAISTDRGATFEVHDEGPVADASPGIFGDAALVCDVDPDGRIAVLLGGRPEPELHTVDPATARWNRVELPTAERLRLATVRHLPDVGWVLTGWETRGADETAIAYISDDLTTWTSLGVETDSDLSSAYDAAVAADRLYLMGSEEGQPALWSLPLRDLPAGQNDD